MVVVVVDPAIAAAGVAAGVEVAAPEAEAVVDATSDPPGATPQASLASWPLRP